MTPLHNEPSTDMNALLQALTKLRTTEETYQFLTDIFSPQELKNLSNRWVAVQLLNKRMNYLDIQKQTGLSSATIAKMSTALKYGTGMLRKVLERVA